MTQTFSIAVANAIGEQPCVVALGGGADSAMLAHAAIEASPSGRVRAVFASHGLPTSDLLEMAVRELVQQLDVALTVVDAATIDGPDLEARARQARYAAIEADLAGGELVLTGHTADDQAETVLMRLMRGSGAGGLAGIPSRRGPWTRPFLAFRRRELRTEAERLGLPFVDDPANEDDRFLRSRVRQGLLPEIAKNYAPGISTDLTRTAEILSRDDEFLTSLSDSIVVSTFHEQVALPAPALVSAPLAVSTRAIRRALRKCGDVYPGSRADIEAVLEVARTGVTAVIGGGIEVHSEPPLVVLSTTGSESCDPPVAVGEATQFPWGRNSFLVERARHPVAQGTAGRFSVVATPDGTTGVAVRGVLPGDRIDIGVGSTPVSELLRDHGVPRASRQCWPVITIGGKIAAVHGLRTAAWATPRNGDSIMIIEREVHS